MTFTIPGMSDSHYESVTTDNLSHLVALDKDIDGAEHDGVRTRWRFGQILLKERNANGGKKLPPGRLETICVATRKSRGEISNRVQLAEECPTEEALSNMLDNHPSWRDICKSGLGSRGKEPEPPPPLPDGVFDLILADPPWQYDFAETDNRKIENQYPTMTVDQIMALDIADVTADNATLYLWTTTAKLVEGLDVLDAWGFTYKSSMVWVKDKIGMGYHARGRHEFILIGTRGTPGTPEPEDRPDSVIEAPRTEHSRKPDRLYEIIETAYPDKKYLELFARRPREGWEAWGNEA